ncbi:putative pentatricopeptide [Rosa chinensis]|uniref:Putative pentatricopeptide n=1 Tax=Rosa chinensis TaxID=74649 RepID=A0A2P6PCA2_ROSCH|nr:pentatricopeptide repeat-containing protein At3g22470, mitochondrial [Rosa chinensis]PRQ19548.1 putative pentatricopeptide [Rosa chinensis]
MTPDSLNEDLKSKFDHLADYDSLNECALGLYTWLENAGKSEEAKQLFKPRSELAVLPDVAIFTIVIQFYTRAEKTKGALKVYHHMLASGVAPAWFTYHSLIKALAKDSSSDVTSLGYAKQYFLEMLDKGMEPDSDLYAAVFAATASQDSVEKAREFLEQAQTRGFLINAFHLEEDHLKGSLTVTKLCNELHKDIDVQNVFHKWCT